MKTLLTFAFLPVAAIGIVAAVIPAAMVMVVAVAAVMAEMIIKDPTLPP